LFKPSAPSTPFSTSFTGPLKILCVNDTVSDWLFTVPMETYKGSVPEFIVSDHESEFEVSVVTAVVKL
jgi:hypothetical protein